MSAVRWFTFRRVGNGKAAHLSNGGATFCGWPRALSVPVSVAGCQRHGLKPCATCLAVMRRVRRETDAAIEAIR